jgi:WD40 repeat protein
MQMRFLSLILLVAVIAAPVSSQQASKPLTNDQVMDLVKAGMETANLVNLVREHGIDFDPNEEYIQALRKAGAEDPVIEALHSARPKPLTKDQVLGLVAQGVPAERAAMLVKERGVDFLVDDTYLETLRLAGGSEGLIAAVRQASAGVTLPILQLFVYPFVNSVAFSPDGKLFAVGCGEVKLFEVATGREVRSMGLNHYPLSHGGVLSVAFSPDGELVASAGSDEGTVELWDVAAGTKRQNLITDTPHSGSAWTVAFSPDGKLLASGYNNNRIYIWELSTGKLWQTLSGHSGLVLSVAFSPDGKFLASGSWDKTVKLWEVATGTLLGTFSGNTSWVKSVAFSPDGKILAFADDSTIRFWEVATGRLWRTVSVPSDRPGTLDGANSVAFSPDGKILASGNSDFTIKIWDSATGVLSETLSGPNGYVGSVAFSRDGRLLISASNDATARIWRLKQY